MPKIDVPAILANAGIAIPESKTEDDLRAAISEAWNAFHGTGIYQRNSGGGDIKIADIPKVNESDRRKGIQEIIKRTNKIINAISSDDSSNPWRDGETIKAIENGAVLAAHKAKTPAPNIDHIQKTIARLHELEECVRVLQEYALEARSLYEGQPGNPGAKGHETLARMLARTYLSIWETWPGISGYAETPGMRFIRITADEVFGVQLKPRTIRSYITPLINKHPGHQPKKIQP